MNGEELPKGWVWTTLGDIAQWSSGGTPKAGTPEYYGGSIPWAVIGDLEDGPVTATASSITETGLKESSAKVVQAGTLFVAMYGSIGKLGIAALPMATNQAIAAGRVSEDIETLYVFWWLRHQRSELAAAGQGGAQKNINQAILKAWPVALAPAAEQRRIVDEIERRFSHLDAAVRSLGAARRRLKSAKRTVILAAIPATWDSTWSTTQVTDVGEARLGLQRSPMRHQGSNMKPYLRVANVFEDRIDLTDVMEMHFTSEEEKRYQLHDGDVLLNEGQSPELLGRPAIWRGENAEMHFTNSLIRFRCGENVSPEWALLVFRHHMHSGRFRKESRITTNIAHLALGRFKTVEFPLPPLDEQRRIVGEVDRRLSLIEAAEREVEASLHKVGQLRRSILAAAFRGELVPQDPDDEPAEVLLERIAAERAAAEAEKKSNGKTARRRRRAKTEEMAG